LTSEASVNRGHYAVRLYGPDCELVNEVSIPFMGRDDYGWAIWISSGCPDFGECLIQRGFQAFEADENRQEATLRTGSPLSNVVYPRLPEIPVNPYICIVKQALWKVLRAAGYS
jgi:hypothetical protein